jgi:hypothetical protein
VFSEKIDDIEHLATLALRVIQPDKRRHQSAVSQPSKQSAAAQDSSIRPIHINVPEELLVDLRRRIPLKRPLRSSQPVISTWQSAEESAFSKGALRAGPKAVRRPAISAACH